MFYYELPGENREHIHKLREKIDVFSYFAMYYEKTLQNDVLFEIELLNEIKEYLFY